MKNVILSILLIISALKAFSQQATVIDPRAITVPRFANLAAITAAIPGANATAGMFVYNNETSSFWYYKVAGGWTDMAAVSMATDWALSGNSISNTNTGNVGIGTIPNTYAKLHIADGGLLAEGPTFLPNSPNFPPISGPGTRLMWYADKAAFRAGQIQENGNNESTFWNKDSVGNHSTAFGWNSRATNSHSFAIGYQANAKGANSLAFGNNSKAFEMDAIAFGSGTLAKQQASVAIGRNALAFGIGSVAIGSDVVAKANSSMTIGSYNESATDMANDIPLSTDRVFQIGNGTFSTPKNAITVLRDGNTGIGVLAPAAKLDVAGTVRIADGTQANGKFLSSDATGLASWKSITSSQWTSGGNDINFQTDNSNNGSGTFSNTLSYSIPDNNPTGITSSINVTLSDKIINPGLVTISMNLSHTYGQDIKVQLISPDGTVFTLINQIDGGSAFSASSTISFNSLASSQLINFYTTYPGTYLPSGYGPVSDLNDLYGKNVSGTWSLKVSDLSFSEVGSLSSWSITFGVNSIGTIGKVGIGTSAPQSTLDVKGVIQATGLKIPTGNVGIGTSTPNLPLQFAQTFGTKISLYQGTYGHVGMGVFGGELRLQNDIPNGKVSLGVLETNGSFTELAKAQRNGAIVFTANGNISANGTAYTSDFRYKKDFKKIEEPLNNLLKMNGLTYHWRNDEFKTKNFSSEKQIGLIAQEVEKIYPELVNTDGEGYKSVNYIGLIPVLIEAIKELKSEVKVLTQNQRDFEARVKSLENLVKESKDQEKIQR